MAAATAKTRVAVSYDSHSDTSASDAEFNEEEGASPPQAVPTDDIEGSEEDVSDSEDDHPDGGSGMANVMAKILGKQTKTMDVVLAKAKTDRQIQYIKREKILKEEDDVPRKKKKDGKEEEEFIKDRRNFALERENLEKKRRWEEMGRVRPNVLEKDYERKLKRIATQGVVQLFNAVKTQQKVIENRLKEVGSSEVKREKVLKSFKKGDFLDMLKPTIPNVVSDPKQMIQKKKPKEEVESDEETESQSNQPGWKILRDDFMMGGTMKDWDKQSDDDSNSDNDQEIHDDSSGDDDS